MKALLLIALAAATCNSNPPAPSPSPAPTWTPAPLPVVTCSTTCCRACVTLARYGCPESRPTPHGETCEELCLAVEASGTVFLPADCVAHASTFADVASCGVKCSR